MAVSIVPQQAEGGISLATQKKPLLDDAVITSRIQKADYALGEHSPGQEELSASFWLGMDRRVRDQAAMAEAIDQRRHWNQVSTDVAKTAASEGRSLTEDEKAFILDSAYMPAPNPALALEERYAKRYVEETAPETAMMAPEVSQEARSVVTKQQVAQRVLEDMQARYNDTSWARWGLDFAKGVIPFYTWSQVADRLKDAPTSSFLTGSNLEQQMEYLYFLPASEFDAALTEAVSEIAQSNVLDAMMFAQAAVSYSNSDALLDDAFFGLDTVDVATLGASVVATRMLKGGRSTATAVKMKQAVAESANPKMTNVDKKVIQGDVVGASHEATLNKLEAAGAVDPSVNPNVLGDVTKRTPDRILEDIAHEGFSLGDPTSYTRRAGSLAAERTRRVNENLQRNDDVLRTSLRSTEEGGVPHVIRMDQAASARALEQAESDFIVTNYRLEDSIVEIEHVRESEEIFGGVDYVHFVVGKKDASAFSSIEQAQTYAEKIYRLPTGSYNVAQRGDSFYLNMRKHVRETDTDVLDLRLTTDNQAPVNWKNTYLRVLANPDDVRGADPSAWAKVATYGGNAVMQKMAEVAQSIGKLGKNETDRLGTILDEARFKSRQTIDPETGKSVDVSGVFYRDIAELEQAYLKRGYSLPNEKEITAYFSFRQLMDFDWAVRNISVWRDKARLGVDQKSVGWIHTDEAGKKIYRQTPFFEGRVLDELPSRANEEYTIAWYNGKTGKTDFALSSDMRKRGRRLEDGSWEAEIDDLLSQGYKIIQIANPRDKAFNNFIDAGGEPIQYILARDMKEKPLSYNQVPWNEGGHWMYPQTGQYLKQARTHKTKFGRRVYDGDMTVHHFQSTKQAAQFQDAYETARKMYLVDDPNLDAFAAANLPYDGEELRKLFTDKRFDPESPFVLTNSGQRVSDISKLDSDLPVVDSRNSEHSLMADINTRFAQERGERLTGIRNTGTEANPLYKLTGAPLIDSLSTLGRSTAEIARSRFLDDYKHRVVENYITQFQDVLDIPLAELRANPMRFIHDPKYLKSADKGMVAAAQKSRRALIYLMGQDTLDMGVMKHAQQKLVDTMFDDKAKVLDAWKWGEKGSDPSVVARSAVFHLKLGMLNVVQFPLQAQAVAHAAAIDGNPLRAVQANFLYWSMRMRGLSEGNNKAQSLFGKAISKALGVNRGLVDEMYEAFKMSGMNVMEGEYARVDDYLNPKQLFGKSGINKGLDAATVFFKEGNLTHRGVSFATSFLSWRQANPTKKLTSREMKTIMERADVMYVNMSRASNNDILASSSVSVPAQFMTYHKNLMEQLLSKRLTKAEKARVIAMYSTLYGAPVGLGLYVAPLWPVHESVRQYVLETGIDTDENLAADFIINGGAKVALEMLTGEDWNVSERYGPGGLSWLRDVRDGLFFEIVAGASGSSLGSAFQRIDPFWYATTTVFAEESENYDLSKADFLQAAREISTVNNIARAYAAATAGKYLTREGAAIMELDPDALDTVMMAFGLSPQEVSDSYLMLRSNKQAEEAKAELSKTVLERFRLGVKSAADGDEEASLAFYKQAHVIMKLADLTPQERKDIWMRAMRENGNLLDRVSREFMMKDPETRMRNYRQRIEEE